MTARLVVGELTGGYPGVSVFSRASFSVESGEILAILGANGSGKSALLETLQGLLANRGGAVLLDGESVQDLAPEGRAARGMSLVSDRRRLFRDMTIDEHFRIGAFRAAARRGWRQRSLRASGHLHGSGATRPCATGRPERRAPAAARAREVRHVLPAGLVAGRSSSGAR